MKSTTAHMYTLAEVEAALDRLVRLGMDPERAREVVAQAYPEYRASLSH